MTFKSSYIPYEQTGSFSTIINDYLHNDASLHSLYAYRPDIEGVRKAIEERKLYKYDRNLLVTTLREQYDTVSAGTAVQANIVSLLQPTTFTICTAHQPNIFTGHLYFVYKIIHAVKLADELNASITDCHFVPVYYMGSEDADLDELGEVVINGKKYRWQTTQKGAVGRMKVDKAFLALINEIEGQLSVEQYGSDILALVKNAYTIGKTIEQATFELVHVLFNDRGLITLLPDNPALKRVSEQVNKKELTGQFSRKAVAETIASFPEKYKVQAAGRAINLFYLKDDMRERVEAAKTGYSVANTKIQFSREEIFTELEAHPERFSPNVILRPVFQEMILPNIVFIGGGGELAYWLELKKVFDAVQVPYPVLVLRNSFLVVNKKTGDRIAKLKFTINDFFSPEKHLSDELVRRESKLILNLEGETKMLRSIYDTIKNVAASVDSTLQIHVEALALQALNRIVLLEKKMFKAEKKKFNSAQRQIIKIKDNLFPEAVLQERIENLLPFYAVFGKEFIELLYKNSKGLAQEFCILEER